MQSLTRLLAVIGLVVLSAICAAQDRTLVPEDRISVTCAQEKSLDREYELTKDGLVLLPYVGAVDVGGASEAEAARKIEKALIEQKILKEATVTVKWIASKPKPEVPKPADPEKPKDPEKPVVPGVTPAQQAPIEVLGSVKKPGKMAFVSGLRLWDVVRFAEPNSECDLSKVTITRGGKVTFFDYASFDGVNQANNPELEPGDAVFFPLQVQKPAETPTVDPKPTDPKPEPAKPEPAKPEPAKPQVVQPDQPKPEVATGVVEIAGSVESPGSRPYHKGITLMQAIEGAGGVWPGARRDRIMISRNIEGKPVQWECNLDQIHKGLASDFELQPGDKVMITGGKPTGPLGRRPDKLKIAAGAALLWMLFGR